MKLPAPYTPFVIGGMVVVMLCVCLAAGRMHPSLDPSRRVEWMTYDWRVRSALNRPLPTSGRIGFVYVNEATLEELNRRFKYDWPLPRKLHGYVVSELAAQGAAGMAFDIFFLNQHRDYPGDEQKLANGESISSDAFFAQQLRNAGNVILGAPKGGGDSRLALPAEVFLSSAAAVGHAVRVPDDDGVLRRVRPFMEDSTRGRVWQLGIVLAAREMKLDLEHPIIEPRRIFLPGLVGEGLEIPLDEQGDLLIDWSLAVGDPRLRAQQMLSVLGSFSRRAAKKEVNPVWQDRLVVVGSTGVGNNISDRGVTPLSGDTYLFSTHWNIADALLMRRFVTRPSLPVELMLIIGMALLSGWTSWRLRPTWATLVIITLSSGYVAFAWWRYVAFRQWLPIVLPVAGALIMPHGCLVAYRLMLERGQRRRVRNLFGRIVSPNIIEMMMRTPNPSWEPARRIMTVFFADIRGFTTFTDRRRSVAEARVEKLGLTGQEAQREIDKAAAETMRTINLYLTTIANCVTSHDGTLDKYIGDCVMAFWGAPMASASHAAAAVHAAIEAQQAVEKLNNERSVENERIAAANLERAQLGAELLPPLELLQVGIGLNTGMMTVGFMGSEEHLSNFTVFGEEVNLASRFQALAGPGSIIAGEATRREASKQDATLASCMISQGMTPVKGLANPVAIIRVLWEKARAV